MKTQLKQVGALLALIMSATTFLNAQTSTKSASSAYQIYGAQWTNLSNISSPDGNNVNCTLDSVGTCTSGTACYISRSLFVEGFNFSIPQNGVIDGIKLQIKRKSTVAGAIKDISICGWSETAGMDIFGMISPLTTTWGTVMSYVDYGGPNELWGITWTPTMINDSEFGFSIECINVSHTIALARIDHIRAVVYYHVGPLNKIQSRDVNSAEDLISIFPDPSSDLINVSIKNKMPIQAIRIFNADGKIVFDKKTNTNDGILDDQIDISALPKGIYLLQIATNGLKFTKKFVKE